MNIFKVKNSGELSRQRQTILRFPMLSIRKYGFAQVAFLASQVA